MNWAVEEDAAAVRAYWARLPLPSRITARLLDGLIREALPRARVGIKWGVPFYALRGPVCYVSGARRHVTLGFLQGADLPDPRGLLGGTGRSPVRSVRFGAPEDVPAAPVRALLRAARTADRSWGADATRGGQRRG